MDGKSIRHDEKLLKQHLDHLNSLDSTELFATLLLCADTLIALAPINGKHVAIKPVLVELRQRVTAIQREMP